MNIESGGQNIIIKEALHQSKKNQQNSDLRINKLMVISLG